ncbi:MAG: zf-HC2 domain-containing protein [Gemmatimonadota bacterium]|nr:MAG: zf-HC2 domain-containing protein [Gemmatimonadota bacterium]
MTKKTDCEVFQDQLDALRDGALPETGVEQLHRHAASCPDCAMLLRLHGHVASTWLGDLEAVVPDELVASVWPRVEAEIATHESARIREYRGWQRWGWLVPALAAATLLLFVSSALLFRDVRGLRQRESALAQEIAEQERRLAELDVRTSSHPVVRTAGLAGRATWARVLQRRRSVSISELAEMLRGLPASTTIFGALELEALNESAPFWTATALSDALAEVGTEDGIQAGELLRLLGALDLDPERRIPTARILAIARGARPVERS